MGIGTISALIGNGVISYFIGSITNSGMIGVVFFFIMLIPAVVIGFIIDRLF